MENEKRTESAALRLGNKLFVGIMSYDKIEIVGVIASLLNDNKRLSVPSTYERMK
jgi:hypothetical protein